MALLHLVAGEAGRPRCLVHGVSAPGVAEVVVAAAAARHAKLLGAADFVGGDAAAAPGYDDDDEGVLEAPGYAERGGAFVAAGGRGRWLSFLLKN
jgi:hypothetical protein